MSCCFISGYVRILLLVASLFYYDKPLYFLILYGVSVALDGKNSFSFINFNPI
jgi:hypothetical protein